MSWPGGDLPADFWSAPAAAGALATCDIPLLMELVRQARGWTQHDLAAAAGYSQSWVSKVMRGKQPLTLHQARDVSLRLGIPVHLLRFEWEGEGPAKRREFGQAVGLALAGRLSAGEDGASVLVAITRAQRQLDATMRSRELARGAAAHAGMVNRMVSRDPSAAGVAAALSEAAGLAAWLHADMCDLGTARTYYRLAIDAARQAGHDLLAGYMVGSLAAFEIEAGDPAGGLVLAGRAGELIGKSGQQAPRAWLAAVEALGHASARAAREADAALERAGRAVECAIAEPPPWPWLFPFDHAKLAGYRALVSVRLGRPADALAAFAASVPAAQPAPKQQAMIMLEVAAAKCQSGSRQKDARLVDEAFELAGEAMAAGVRYESERVLQRARKFRSAYSGAVTGRVRGFDQQLLAVHA
jgi:transcriptional regulator with XRE-family HTH domain